MCEFSQSENRIFLHIQGLWAKIELLLKHLFKLTLHQQEMTQQLAWKRSHSELVMMGGGAFPYQMSTRRSAPIYKKWCWWMTDFQTCRSSGNCETKKTGHRNWWWIFGNLPEDLRSAVALQLPKDMHVMMALQSTQPQRLLTHLAEHKLPWHIPKD